MEESTIEREGVLFGQFVPVLASLLIKQSSHSRTGDISIRGSVFIFENAFSRYSIDCRLQRGDGPRSMDDGSSSIPTKFRISK